MGGGRVKDLCMLLGKEVNGLDAFRAVNFTGSKTLKEHCMQTEALKTPEQIQHNHVDFVHRIYVASLK